MISAAPLPPQHTALLLIGAETYLSRRAPVGSRPALDEAATLLRHARRTGAHVLHVRRVREGEPRRELHRYAVKGDPRRRAVLAQGETVVDTHASSPFADTPLYDTLAALEVETVVVAGVMTATSCTATTNAALALHYRTVVASEYVGDAARDAKRRLGAEVLCSASIRALLDAAQGTPPLRAPRRSRAWYTAGPGQLALVNGQGSPARPYERLGRNRSEPPPRLPRSHERSMPPTIDSEVMP